MRRFTKAKQANCDHLVVRVKRIVRRWSNKTRSRTIGGTCDLCGKELTRDETQKEIDTGQPETQWK